MALNLELLLAWKHQAVYAGTKVRHPLLPGEFRFEELCCIFYDSNRVQKLELRSWWTVSVSAVGETAGFPQAVKVYTNTTTRAEPWIFHRRLIVNR